MSCFKLNASRALESSRICPSGRELTGALHFTSGAQIARLPGRFQALADEPGRSLPTRPQRAPPHSVAIEEIFAHAYHRIPTTAYYRCRTSESANLRSMS